MMWIVEELENTVASIIWSPVFAEIVEKGGELIEFIHACHIFIEVIEAVL